MLTSGQDLQCVSCKRKAYLLDTASKKGKIDKENFFNSAPLMRCSKCKALLHHSKFDETMKDNWISVEDDAPAVVCINCLRGHCHDKREEVTKLQCDQCANRGDDVPTEWPEGAFFAEDVSNWRLNKTLLKCAACKLEAGEKTTEVLTQVCQKCDKSIEFKGPPHGFSPILVREFLEDGKTVHQGSRIFKDRWKCFNCQYPKCTKCKARPEFAGPSHTCYTKEGGYMCPTCRYPTCAGGCGKARPKASKYSVEVQKTWTCALCQLGGKQCAQCHKQKPPDAFDKDAERRHYAVCNECQHPACATCGQKSTEIWTPNPRVLHDVYTCQACATKTPCAGPCGQTLPLIAFDSDARVRKYQICQECQWPKCAKCRQKSKTIWRPPPAARKSIYTCTACAEKDCPGPCKRTLPQSAFDKNKHGHWYAVCRACRQKKRSEEIGARVWPDSKQRHC